MARLAIFLAYKFIKISRKEIFNVGKMMNDKGISIKAICDLKGIRLIPELTKLRWKRSASGDRTDTISQASLDETYSWIFFLYCFAYLLLVFGTVLVCEPNGRWLLLGGFAVCLVAIVGDAKTMRHEIEMMDKLP